MPPRKKKRKAKTPKSRPTQSQSQRVTINIGSTSKSKPRKSSGRGNLPPPSHMHNLAPTFVTAPQVDYTPLLAMMQHHSSPIVAQAPMPVQNPTTPLSSANVATNTISQMAGLAAEARRAGPTAGNFQAPASKAGFKPITKIGGEQSSYKPVVQPNPPQVRPPDPYVTQQLVQSKAAEEPSSGIGIPFAEARFVDPPSAKQAEVVGFKTPERQQQQTKEKRGIKDIVDQKLKSGEPLTQSEISKAMQKSSQIGDGRKKKLIKAGYTQFEK